ncbi:MAG TPA: CaiB/BaiF CoA-transferase family protein [Allosphingosinicella sp.]|nr:CaiB/BaiF CoA-transferase family protein [Allosphingosinicella sp.]
MSGPLSGIRILEMAGLGPAPFCGMMLADHGAEVIRIERQGGWRLPGDPLARSRRTVTVDLKHPDGVALVRDLAKSCDGLIEGYRPGVMERLGLGPDSLLADNPKLVYGRMTGWGQTGPLAGAAGHDINYIALSGTLHTIGRADENGRGRPSPPVNYVGDFGGGGMMLAFAMVSALLAVRGGGAGQAIDCAMTDGSALLASLTWGLSAAGLWEDQAGVNRIDGGSPYYDTYETKDGKWVAVGAIEPQFYALLCDKVGIAAEGQDDRAAWADRKQRLAALFAARTRDQWCALLEGTDACFAPVLSLAEAPKHPHNKARGTFIQLDGVTQPAPAPRYSETPNASPQAPLADADALLAELGYAPERIAALRASGIVA